MVASVSSLLKRVVVRVSSSSVTGVAVPQTMLEMPSFRLSPTHTGEVTARSPSPSVTRMK
jgi:hypothetical protein